MSITDDEWQMAFSPRRRTGPAVPAEPKIHSRMSVNSHGLLLAIYPARWVIERMRGQGWTHVLPCCNADGEVEFFRLRRATTGVTIAYEQHRAAPRVRFPLWRVGAASVTVCGPVRCDNEFDVSDGFTFRVPREITITRRTP